MIIIQFIESGEIELNELGVGSVAWPGDVYVQG